MQKEVPGEGKGELSSAYTYYVETLNNNRRIYLCRPTYLHNGFDFVICVESINFNPFGRQRNNPTHDDILNDLKKNILKKLKNMKFYTLLWKQLILAPMLFLGR